LDNALLKLLIVIFGILTSESDIM